ncbi:MULTISPECIES: aspartate-alanine antiporter [Tatumella]|uniref:Aspartate-alanine antiporter n=1 Tax=Tatumella punctata TaxID=399969 RepID=A0ABW1VTS1_9GAMM|nr:MULTISPECIES: aspartate-alanine antiporter [unclassified Tatumella]MBS0857434.1 aspartate-alanine antiporter [Tatumella sp. JGM16]MBS0877799.1 aspartate-alanine antiporter [Tatumella sp. JGM82]MBS0891504.1 aspartate-alanine antiporter [Tatumella sp. JGM94]MBS0894409.1 aspartate-alanine antiporter [Tatumella sp. JGM130]MBS0902434.1 aspartate-alanine antiporter [Tatumella sp. JGM100]
MVIWIWLTATLRANPELAIFLTLAIGYRVGSLKFGGFSLGPVTGTLLAGVLIGQLGIDISPQIKSIFFILFLFAVGFGVGPQFVRGLANDGLPQAVFAVVISLLCLLGVYIAARVSGYGPGLAAGLLAGSQTISASIGLATDAINQLGLPPQQTKQQLDLIPVAYAVCYLFGTIGTGWIIAFAGPKILRIDLEKECKRYEQQLSAGAPADGMMSAWNQYVIRAFKINQPGLIEGKTVAEAEKSAGERLFLENLRRDGKIIPFTPDTRLQIGDIIAVSGKHESLIEWSQRAEEVNDAELLNIPVESVDLFITNKWINGKTLLEIARHDDVHGVYLTRIRRGSVGVDIPVQAQTVLNRGDIVTLVGTRKHVDAASQRFGYADRPKSATDMVLVGAGILIGGLVGAIVVPVAGIPLTLSTSGGALIAGLVTGWLRTFIPKLGNVPASTLWFMNSAGLNIFIAVVGITAGPTFIAGLKYVGFTIFFWGLFATAMPMLLAPLIGKYIFRFDPAINLGCCGGARTSTASVAMVADAAKSNVPMLGYTVPYAVSNTFLTLWGLVIILLIG